MTSSQDKNQGSRWWKTFPHSVGNRDTLPLEIKYNKKKMTTAILLFYYYNKPAILTISVTKCSFSPQIISCSKVLKGFSTGLSKMCYFGMWVIFSWRQGRPCKFTRNFYFSLKEFRFGAFPIVRVNTRNIFLLEIPFYYLL